MKKIGSGGFGTVYKLNNLLEICKNFLEENIKKLVLQLK